MISIALCDDLSVQLTILEDIVSDYMTRHNLSYSLMSFKSGDELLSHARQDGTFDIYFLDMIMPGLQGIDVGRELRHFDRAGKIIYLTSTPDYAVDSYSVGAFFYLLKPVNRARIDEILERACEEIFKDRQAQTPSVLPPRRAEIRTGEGTVVITLSELLCVDIVNRRPCYHMADGTVHTGIMLRKPFAQSVAAIASEEAFVFAGSHFLIQLSAVEQVSNSYILFHGGVKLHPSKSTCVALQGLIRTL